MDSDIVLNLIELSKESSYPRKTNKSARDGKLNKFKTGSQNDDIGRRDKFDSRSAADSDQVPSGNDSFQGSFVSSIFNKNPDVPYVPMSKIDQGKEELFTSEMFNAQKYLHPHLVGCLKGRFDISEMTSIQIASIPTLINTTDDALIKSSTGSGKTLAYAIPIVQDLQCVEPRITRSDGMYALILVPTRELALQVYETFSLLCKSFTWLVPGCLMGGEKKKSEKARIRKGLSILVATPGRLIDHIDSTTNLGMGKLKWLVIDEADRLYEQGFQESASRIIHHIKEKCVNKPRTVLLSATLSAGVQKLAGMTLTDPKLIDPSETNDANTISSKYILPSQLKQYFIIVPAKLRLVLLSSFIIHNCVKSDLKALVFMTTQDMVDFHHHLFEVILRKLMKKSQLRDVGFFKLHGSMSQSDRMQVFSEFKKLRAGLLLCTDVAARGLDLPKVDWIVQYSCPALPEDYVHRVGRTARIGLNGNCLIFLLPSEINYLETLRNCLQINIEQLEIEELIQSVTSIDFENNMKTRNAHEYASQLHMTFENEVYHDDGLLDLAKKAYLSYIRSYASYPRSVCEYLPFKQLHLGHAAKSYCLRESPSTLGANGIRFRSVEPPKFQRFGPFKGIKRPFTSNKPRRNVSEFDSGLDYAVAKKDSKGKHKKKRLK